jgi:hypothetical protein
LLLFALATAALTAAAALPPATDAAPASYYVLPDSASQSIADLAAAGDGTLWLVQREGEAGRVLHVDGAGNVLATSSSVPGLGNAGLYELVPATTGVWITAGAQAVDHVAPDGTVTSASSPVGGGVEAQTLVSGHDGRGWYLSCEHGKPETCDAIAVPVGGAAQAYLVPALDVEWPTGADGSWLSGAVATEAGVWFEKDVRVGLGPAESHLGYVSNSGQAHAVTVPAAAEIVAPAGPESVWWLLNEGLAGATVGRVDANGVISGTRHLASLSEDEALDVFVAAPGRDGAMVWAQNATWNETYDGQIGSVRPDGTSAEYRVPHGATYLPTTEANFWSGNCQFGVRLYEAVDGSLWTITDGSPARVTRQQPSGVFETYALGGIASEYLGERGTAIGGMVETNPRALYFLLNTATGPELAKVDPLDPPPAAPRFAAAAGSTGKTRESHSVHTPVARVRIQGFLTGLLRKVRQTLAHGGPAKVVSVRLPEAGTAAVRAKGRSGRRWKQLLRASISGGAGVHALRLDPTAADARLRTEAKPKAHLTVSFKPLDGAGISRSIDISLSRSARFPARSAGG